VSAEDDPQVRDLRARISELDREVLGLVNERLRVVGELWRLKAERGYETVDASREERMLAELERANAGPLTREGVQELQRELLALTKREHARGGG
jgi:3-deoxy-7-phosphoheptulonate synthase/chorismate mutase